jgi:hypothetical protein
MVMHRERLAQVTAPHFCAGLVFVRRVVTEAAPILNNRRFSLIGWDADRVLAHCRKMGWQIQQVAST